MIPWATTSLMTLSIYLAFLDLCCRRIFLRVFLKNGQTRFSEEI